MYEHLIELASQLADLSQQVPVSGETIRATETLRDALAKPDLTQFPSDQRLKIQQASGDLNRLFLNRHGWSTRDVPDLVRIGKMLSDALPMEMVESGPAPPRRFATIRDAKLRRIVERDYHELVHKLFPVQAYKSAIILSGSILEAVLRDALYTDRTVATQARASARAPRRRDNSLLPMSEWKLAHMIDVATDLGILDSKRESLIDISLREYRNFVHPTAEVRHPYDLDETELKAADAALSAVIKHMGL